MTPAGIEPATFRFVKLCYRGPSLNKTCLFIYLSASVRLSTQGMVSLFVFQMFSCISDLLTNVTHVHVTFIFHCSVAEKLMLCVFFRCFNNRFF